MAIDHRVRFAEVFDNETREHDEAFRAAAAIKTTDCVLDVGCGTGQSTRDAARTASSGSALGIDISRPSIEHARHVAAQDGLDNVAYEIADVQVHPFPAEFDICISSFGVMFFVDPHAAFANLARALRPGGRLTLLVWGRQEDNEWSVAIRDIVGWVEPEPFSLGDPDVVRGLLRDFTDVHLTDVHAPVRYGPDAATAYGFVTGLRDTAQALAAMDTHAADVARGRLRALVAAHESADGVLFGSRAWVITGRRR